MQFLNCNIFNPFYKSSIKNTKIMELKSNCKHSYEDKKSSKHGTKSNCIEKEKEKREKRGGLQILFGPPPPPPQKEE
jgi:hypothetical protein